MPKTSKGATAVCSHVQALTDWVPAVVAAQAAQADGMLCASCCQTIGAAEQAAGRCNQGHHVGLELRTGRVHCLVCRTCTAPDSLAASRQAVQAARRMLRSGMTPGGPPNDPAPQVLAKRRRLSKRQQQQQASATPPTSINTSVQAADGGQALAGFKQTVTRDGLPLGLRGLNNLGNTCFMNSVLQAFLHTPLVRLYYLGEGHAPATCRWQSSRPCLSCEMDTLFSSMYSGERQPYSPVDFLYAWWCQADKLAEYQQQDAHEFYLSALSALSNSSALTHPPANNTKPNAARLSGNGAPAGTQGTQPAGGAGTALQTAGILACAASPAGPVDRVSEMGMPAHSGLSSLAGITASQPGAQQGQHHAAGGSSSDDDQSASGGAGRREAHGMVEAVFGGLLRSDVRCSVCGHTSTAYDPYLDISLDLLAASKTNNQEPLSGTTVPSQQQRPAAQRARNAPASAPATTPPSSMDNVSGAEGPQGGPCRSGAARGGGGRQRGGGHGGMSPGLRQAGAGLEMVQESEVEGDVGGPNGPAGASESCSLGEHRAYPHLQQNNNNSHPQLTRRLSESSVQDEMSHRVTPEISDVSSLLVVPDPAPHQQATTGGTGSRGQKPPAPPRRGATGKPPAQLQPSGLGTPSGPGRGQRAPAHNGGSPHSRGGGGGGRSARPEVSLEAAESQMQAANAVAVVPPSWESPLDDSMSSPLRPKPGHQATWRQQLELLPPADGAGQAGGLQLGQQGSLPQSLDDVLMQVQQEGESSAAVGGDCRNGTGQEDSQAVSKADPGAPAQPPLSAPPTGGGSGGRKKGGRARQSKAVDTRMVRCGECHTCLNRHLKKACLRNKALKDVGAQGQSGDEAVLPTTPLLGGGDGAHAARELSQCGDGVSGMQQQGAGGGMEVSVAGPDPSPLRPQLTPEPSDLCVTAAGGDQPEASMIEEPACSHLAMQTVAWPVGQGQHRMAAADSSRQEAGEEEPRPGGQAKRGYQGQGTSSRADTRAPAISLHACLAHFIQEEALHTSEAWVCSHCKRRQQASKQMSIRRLPPVLCLHVKRFEQALGSMRVVRKLHTRLAFPTDTLDMTPFMTSTLLHERYQAMAAANTAEDGLKQEQDPDPFPPASAWSQPPQPPTTNCDPSATDQQGGPEEFMYSLFSVICHKGDITGGHYVSYVRCCGAWFCCDDAWVTMVEEEEVAQCQAYMLYYTQSKFKQTVASGF